MALAKFSLPPLIVALKKTGLWSTVESNKFFILAPDAEGLLLTSSAAAPATCGVANAVAEASALAYVR